MRFLGDNGVIWHNEIESQVELWLLVQKSLLLLEAFLSALKRMLRLLTGWACKLFEGIRTSKHTTTNSFVRIDLSSIVRWSAGILSQSRVSVSFSVRSRMLPATTGSSALATIAQLDSRFEKLVIDLQKTAFLDNNIMGGDSSIFCCNRTFSTKSSW